MENRINQERPGTLGDPVEKVKSGELNMPMTVLASSELPGMKYKLMENWSKCLN
jgi:hypothetical protein